MNADFPNGSSVAWMDRLVELHVLAEHGDPEALAEAEHWMERDVRARAAWETVARECTELSARSMSGE